jgi:hypothetical protein
MHIQFKGKNITNLAEWKNFIFVGKKEKHWKAGRSAYSLADFIINHNGLKEIEKILSSVILEPFVFDKVYPEYETRFDKCGHGREHDLAIWGRTNSGKRVFIGIESKVDETFGDTIGEAYIKAKTIELNGKKTNAPNRIEKLLKATFHTISKSDFNLRYQLLFSTASILCMDADIHIFLILVFKTNLYNTDLGKENKKDLKGFLKRLNVRVISNDVYTGTIDKKELIIIYKEI